MIAVKRVYDPPARSDGFRVLVDRLWPRGLSKRKARVDLWLRDLAPSNALRKWFGHDPEKWPEFARRYKTELQKNKEALAELRKARREHAQITLLYGAKDVEHNNAIALLKFLR
jgi:uncharacterized protein YeaO (DUF488 family)